MIAEIWQIWQLGVGEYLLLALIVTCFYGGLLTIVLSGIIYAFFSYRKSTKIKFAVHGLYAGTIMFLLTPAFAWTLIALLGERIPL